MEKTLSRDAFELLCAAAQQILRKTESPLWQELQQAGLLHGESLTEAGLAALEPYRVKRAVILAAGFGSRLMPATADCPKPMVKVKGKSIIETLLEAITEAGIPEIYLVRGYRGERFDALLEKYPHIQFLENPYYNEANNISTAWIARELIQDAYVCEADLAVIHHKIIRPYEYETNYLGAWEEEVHDWCFWTNQQGYVRLLSDSYGTDCYRMFGISYWTAEDGKRLADYLDNAFMVQKQWKKYWDEVSMMDHLSQFSIYVRPCSLEDVLEIDTYEELLELEKNERIKL